MSTQKHIAIIGAGIIGSCCALELKKRGYRVTIIDGKGISEGCSYGNAGHFATEQVFPLAEFKWLPKIPKMLLDPLGAFRVRLSYWLKAMPWFMRFLVNMFPSRFNHNKQALKTLNTEALAAYHRLLDQELVSEHIHTIGSLLAFETSDRSKVESVLKHYQGEDISVSLLNRQESLALEPNLSNAVNYTLYFDKVGHTSDPAALCRAIASSADSEFIKENARKIVKTNKGWEVVLHSQTLTCDSVLVCAGVWSKTLLKPLGYGVPIEAERGYHLMTPSKHLLNRPVASAERSFIMTPMSDGLRLAGTVEFAGVDAAPDYNRSDMLAKHAQVLLNDFQAPDQIEPNQRWMGCRPSLPDSLPVIGASEQHPQLYFAFGHQHLGLTLGAITSELIGQIVSGENTTVDISPFRIERF